MIRVVLIGLKLCSKVSHLILIAVALCLTAPIYADSEPTETGSRQLPYIDIELTQVHLEGDQLVSEYLQLRNPAAFQFRLDLEREQSDTSQIPTVPVIGDVYRWSIPLESADIRLGTGKKISATEYRQLYGDDALPVILTEDPERLIKDFQSHIALDALVLKKIDLQSHLVEAEYDVFDARNANRRRMYLKGNLVQLSSVASLDLKARTELIWIPREVNTVYYSRDTSWTVLDQIPYEFSNDDLLYLTLHGVPSELHFRQTESVTETRTRVYYIQVPYMETQTHTYEVQIPYSEIVTDEFGNESIISRTKTETHTREVAVEKWRAEEQIQEYTVTVPLISEVTRAIPNFETNSMLSIRRKRFDHLGLHPDLRNIACMMSSVAPLPQYAELFNPQIEWIQGIYPAILSSPSFVLSLRRAESLDVSKVSDVYAFNNGVFVKLSKPDANEWVRLTHNQRFNLIETDRDDQYIYLTISTNRKQMRIPTKGGVSEFLSPESIWKPYVETIRVDHEAKELVLQLADRNNLPDQ